MRFIAICLVAFSLAAQEHRIARIEVRGDVPASIVVAQSALAEGRTYRTSDIETGIARLRRLPFVYDARYVIDGETLRIEVTGETPVFGEAEVSASKTEIDDNAAALVAVGARHFLGAGVVEARASNVFGEGDDPREARLQYSHYAIGGTRLFATAAAAIDLNQPNGVDRDPIFSLSAGYPLTIRQTLTASAFRVGSTSSTPLEETAIETEDEITGVNLRWTYDTSDDPYFARRGAIVTAGPSWTRSETRFDFEFVPPPPFDPIHISGLSTAEVQSLSAEGTYFLPYRTRSVFFGNLAVFSNESEFALRQDELEERQESEMTATRLSLGFGHNVFDRDGPLTSARHRVEIAAAASRFDADDFGTSDDYSLLLGYVFRARFARVGVNVTYVFDQTDSDLSDFRYTGARPMTATR